MELNKTLDIRREHKSRLVPKELVVTEKDMIFIKAIAMGKGDKQIAMENGWASSTADSYRTRILKRFGAINSSHLVSIAYKMKLLRP